MNQHDFDNKLKQLFQAKAETMPAPENKFLEIKRQLQKKEESSMKSLFSSKKAKGILVAAAICVVSISCYAGIKASSFVGHSSTKYTEMPTAEQVKKEAGFIPKYVENFQNGFTFSALASGETSAQDENGNALDVTKQLTFLYEKGQGKCHLNIEPETQYNNEAYGEEISLDGMTGYYYSDKYVFVPNESAVTPEDRKLEAEGKLYISYGSDKREEETFSGVIWTQDGLKYQFSSTDTSLSKDDLIAMAKEVINQ